MKKLIATTSLKGVGCTFIEWSINFLSGQNQYLHYEHGLIDLVSNPIQEYNSHGHAKNHPPGLQETKKCVQYLKTHADFATLYPFELSVPETAKILGIDVVDISSADQKRIKEYSIADYNNTLRFLSSQDVDIVYISLDSSLALYLHFLRSLILMPDFTEATSIEQARSGIDTMYFNTSATKWKELELTSTWDRRERLALDSRPFNYIAEDLDLSMPHIWIDSREVWYDGDQRIPKLVQELGLNVDPSRIEHWKEVYFKWQQIHLNILRFVYKVNHIIEATLHGWDYPIDLTFDQEVVIQHCLIYRHGLNLKTWQLEKFPNNTRDLNKLLEPNIHPVEQIY